ncbi:DEAD/DEAH box helicase family protein [Aeromonas dhakensis]|uniref:hypothetical protein n=1 Tax=Aeromonas dhakensis TaxID=196024 RepID=UPI0038D13873
MTTVNGGICARRTIELTSSEYISDHINELPTGAGMHLVIAPTGAGKSHAMTHHSAANNGAVIFPVKAVMVQQLEETEKQKINANIYQLERFQEPEANKVDVIHFDECQLIYEGGFRKDVETFTALLIEQSKVKPVYCYSATYNEKIDFVKWKTVTVFDKEFKREFTSVALEKNGELVSSGRQVRQYRSTVAASVIAAHIESKLPVTIAFLNSKSKCIEIRDEIQAVFPHIRIELSNSEINAKSSVISHIMKTSTVSGCGADIILSTSSLEAGININDPVCIVSEQTEAGKLFQRFGRARKAGKFYMIGGSGTGRVDLTASSVVVRDDEADTRFDIKDTDRNTLSQYMNQTCMFTNREHAMSCDRFSTYVDQCDSLRNSFTVMSGLQELGYALADSVQIEIADNAVKFKRGSKVTVCECIRQHVEAGKKLHGNELDELIKDVIDRTEIDHMTATVHVQKFIDFEIQMKLVNSIKQDALTVFEKLSVNGQSFILSMSMNESTDVAGGFVNELYSEVDETIKLVRESAGNVVMTGEKLDEWCNTFWQAVVNKDLNFEWFEDDNKRTRTRLFRYLMGWVEDEIQKRWVIVDEAAWWDVELDRAEQVKKVRVVKELKANGYELGDVCEYKKMNQRELLNSITPKKLVKQLKSDADWGV